MDDKDVPKLINHLTILVWWVLVLKLFLFVVVFVLFWLLFRLHRRMMDSLNLSKEWAQIGRDQHSDAVDVMAQVREQTNVMADASSKVVKTAEVVTKKAEEVHHAVEEVPDKVVERIKEISISR